MKVYFVRHGQSIFNIEPRHQFPDTPLSKTGIKQAVALAERFTSIPIDSIITSSYTRAIQTAQEIKKVRPVSLIESNLFIERKLPSSFVGKLVRDPEIAAAHELIREHLADPKWHYADEENFIDLLARAKAGFDFIHSQKKNNIVVVTHGYFLNVMMYYVLFRENTDHRLFKFMKDRIEYSNTGLTVCQYKDEKWKLLTLNDYAHLGE